MRTLTRPILLFAVLAAAASARAGSPDGLNLVAIAAPSAASYAGALQRFVRHARDSGVQCGEYALNLAILHTVPPAQLTSELALQALHDKAKRKQLGRLLTGFRDKSVERGFDAALAYEVRQGQLRLYGISGASDEQPVVVTLPVAAAARQERFDVAACKAVASLPVLAEP
ncbi:hypothetical protein [Pseudoduganella armeniaca]|uniref:DUF4252 domain-containing protein n=1 Tax=Pseudoduganella armeniaca TaxID=2072590 RepID=A0A2R4CC11_9BURK|nr:hypothetical protein [Pseudoduganella armeniaca]AVR97102.1 hypothetical protein C9I28_16715 [Pseudoduganella armeniaca]